MNILKHFSARRLGVVLMDLSVVMGSYYLAFLLRFEFSWNGPGMQHLAPTVPYAMIVYVASFALFSLSRGIFYFSSFSDLINIVKAIAAAALVYGAGVLFVRQGQFSRSILILHPILAFVGVGGVRFGIRFVKTYLNMPRTYAGEYRHALIIGAGELGANLLRQMQLSRQPQYKVVGFIDDDPGKWKRRIHGVTVLGGRAALTRVLEAQRVDEIVIAIASQRGGIVRAVVESLAALKERPELKIAPSLEEMLVAPSASRGLRKVRPADLLNRAAVKLDTGRIGEFLAGKTALVTGAGGTIGAELSRQALEFRPACVVLIDNHATSLFYTEAQLQRRARGASVVPVLGDIRDQALLDRVFSRYRPAVVLHAAAHKHLYQLESNVHEGVSNNILSTYYLARAASGHGAEMFLLVSTDKAVRPSSVMGATKRVAERIVGSFAAQQGATRFAAVRFGNVLGSSGSVLEIFQRQLASGGPMTVTHPEVTRYFMTVEEAAQLILQTAAMASGGEIFVLKMGTPIKIVDMARDVALLSGVEPGKDVEIRFTGLKPGEKLEEELSEDSEACDHSEHPSITIVRPALAPVPELGQRILDLEIMTRQADADKLLQELRGLVPTFGPFRAASTADREVPQRLEAVDPSRA